MKTSRLELASPAKINLMLHITGRRADGYHLLETVFQFIDLSDDLVFEVSEDGLIQRINSTSPVATEDDILIKTANLLKTECLVASGVNISINKRIPLGGGLGGGSSNAACCLHALNYLWNLGLSLDELAAFGLRLGADVPVFVHGQAAWASGIGELLTPVELPEPWILLIHPGIEVSTAEIFNSEELTRNSVAITIRAFLEGSGTNVCEPVACKLYPQIQQAISWLNHFASARMTGSGACVFAPFDSLEQAESVKSRIPDSWTGFVVKAMNQNPVLKLCRDPSQDSAG